MKIKRIIDISRKIHNSMAVWPRDDLVKMETVESIACRISSIRMSLHTGTHIDAPIHFVKNGKSILDIDLYNFLGYAKIFDLSKVEKEISCDDIKKIAIEEDDVIFFKTRNSSYSYDDGFRKDYVYISAEAAEMLAGKKIKTIGVDYFSVGGYNSSNTEVHKTFLYKDIGIIEGLDLSNVDEGKYFFSCLPLKIDGADGTPARAVLVEFY